ncbi:prenyltransferase/squalene oxidase repeat-containing protein [Lacipirellula sp.]|uniref:prenyltransferase/squalene oxidase repeat-containing protein n=1 Tax=Lacipirellula sp. TaxID=2691419 RepID=UPI003D0B138D
MSSPLDHTPPPHAEPPDLPAPLSGSVLNSPVDEIAAVAEPPVEPPSPAIPLDEPLGLIDRLGAWLEESGAGAWVSSAVVHGVLFATLSIAILSSQRARELFDDEASGPLSVEPMEVGVGELPIAPTDDLVPSLGPFELGDEISLPGEVSDMIGSPIGEELTPQLGGLIGDLPSEGAVAANVGSGVTAASAANSSEFGGGLPLDTLLGPSASRGGGLEGRKLENRRAAALAGGGTVRSEEAVEAALVWMKKHQWSDGGWRFDLQANPNCVGQCGDSGSNRSKTAATGLALLTFLGAGYTHKEGPYKEVVGHGLYFLQEQMTVTTHGGDLRDGDNMYSQGIATLALTEAYAMTHDRELRKSAILAIQFILEAQYNDGGWRYTPNFEAPMAGDTTVSGWQIAALKSASLTDIELPSNIWERISSYLDSVQYDDGMNYLYVQGDSPNRRTASTPIGLLCRMIGGWKKNYRPLRASVSRLGQVTPSTKDVYFNYYASQVLHHVGGSNWKRWNPRMREHLISTQATAGHEKGSWYFSEPHSSAGGRLYSTALATMTLEVYYRYMPLYQDTFVDNSSAGNAEVD